MHGFANVDALEPSELADLAKSKQIYRNIIQELIQADSATSIPEGKFLPNHVDRVDQM